MSASLKNITLHAARSKAFPDGSFRHGYVLAAPLNEEGRIDAEAWKTHRGECFVHRFWGEDPEQRGLLVHRAGGPGGSIWRLEFGEHQEMEEQGFRFADHVFRPGEYVSIREADGELMTFKVISVK